jgi:type I restriction enzyme S subunit
VRPLKHLAVLSSGGTPSKERQDFWDGDIPWASAKDLKSELLHDTADHITDAAIDSGAQLVPPGAVLVLVRGMMLARAFPVCVAGRPMAINQDLKALVSRPGMRNDFLAWLLRGTARETLDRLDEAGHGTKALRMEAWTSMKLPAPPEAEQRAIVAFLDRETAKIDALVEEQRRLIELLKEKRQAVISHAVTKGLAPSAPMKDSGVEWLGEVPAHWTLCRLKHVVQAADGIQMGPFGGMLTDLASEATGLKLYGQENTISGDFERGNRWLKDEQFRELQRYQLLPGDFVVTRKGTLGGCRLVPNSILPGIADSDTIRVRVDKGWIDPQFALILLQDAIYISAQIELTKRGAILAGLNTDVVANLRLALPPLDEQRTVCSHVEDADRTIFDLINENEAAIGLLTERRDALISAAVTGKIDVRERAAAPAELEPA